MKADLDVRLAGDFGSPPAPSTMVPAPPPAAEPLPPAPPVAVGAAASSKV